MFSSFIESFMSVGQNVLILFIMIGMGAACKFARLMNEDGVKGITNLELSVVTPCLLIMSFQREYSADQLKTIILSAAIAVAFHALSILLAHLLIHDRDASRQAVLRFSTVFTNAGFMSLPLQYALLGADGVFCGAVVVGFFQVLVWTYGVWLMGGTSSDFSLHHILLNPGVCGIACALLLFLCRIRLPNVVAQPLNYMAALNTPVAMVIIGFHLASSRFGAALRDPKAILSMLLRQFRLLQHVKIMQFEKRTQEEIRSALGVPPFALNQYLRQASFYTGGQVKQAVKICFDTEYAVKSGKMNQDGALEAAILKILYLSENE